MTIIENGPIDNTVDPDNPEVESQQDHTTGKVTHIYLSQVQPVAKKTAFGIKFVNSNAKICDIFWEKADGLFVNAEGTDYSPMVTVEFKRRVNQVSDGELCGIWRARNNRTNNDGFDLDKPLVDIDFIRFDGVLVVQVVETVARVRMENIFYTMELTAKAIHAHLMK